jgi:hypothetical protein
MSTTSTDVGTEAALNQAIAAADAATSGSFVIRFTQSITEGTDTGSTAVIGGQTVDLPPDLFALNLQPGVSLTIDGAGFTLDGAGQYRGLLAYAGNISVDDLSISDADAIGGAGGSGAAPGGGGAGLGGGLFVAAGASVTIDAVTFSSDAAIGGAGGVVSTTGGGGGGGLGGAGGNGGYPSTQAAANGGGGGIGADAAGGSSGGDGQSGVVPGAAGGGQAAAGGIGGPSGGGGGSAYTGGYGAGGAGGGGVAGQDGPSPYTGGPGGFGGGGGAAAFSDGGSGGFGGGGGGGYSFGGQGGFGGGGGAGIYFTGGAAGFGAGVGGRSGGGGGGLGAGGDLFVQQGAALTIEGGTLTGGSVSGGAAGSSDAGAGQGYGSGVFLQGTQSVTLSPIAGEMLVVADDVTDAAAHGGTGGGSLVLGGAGNVALDGTTDLSGTVMLESGTLAIGDATHMAATISTGITFGGPAALDVNSVADGVAFTAGIAGFALGDTIDLAGIASAGVQYTAGQITYALPGAGSESFDLALASPGRVQIATDGAGGTRIDLLCFLRGTRIATPEGEVPVEALRAGDLVLTLPDRAPLPVRWIGLGRHLVSGASGAAAAPVVVRAGALEPGVPIRDLRVSRGHALFLDGVLIPVESLVNGTSIAFDHRPQVVELFHVELDRHAVLLADGAPAESFRDDGNGLLFENARPPGARRLPPCAPIVTGGPVVERVWRRLWRHAGPHRSLPLTADPDLHLLADGQRIDAQAIESDLSFASFVLRRLPRELRIVSRSAVPALIGRNADQRRLGVALRRIVIAGRDGVRDLGLDFLPPGHGWHAPEPAEGLRWTDGDALMPAAALSGISAPLTVALHLGVAGRYRLPLRDAAADPSSSVPRVALSAVRSRR